MKTSAKKTYNVWAYDSRITGPTGGWKFLSAILAQTADDALNTAKSRFGLYGHYNVYESI